VKRVKQLSTIVVAGAMLATALAEAQGFRRRVLVDDHVPPATEVIASRWRFGTNGLIGHTGWSHNYPRSERNLNAFVAQSTRIDIETQSYKLVDLGSEEIFLYPYAYVSEPGEMELTEQEVANLREFVDRGGFVLIDDFDDQYGYDHMANLREEMLRAFPNRHFERLTGEHPIFDLIFQVRDLKTLEPYGSGGELVYWALTNAAGEVAVVACFNNDLANFWDWYGNPRYPLAPATEAFRMGVNFLVHSLTH
jgi:hypothetical protein